jgi:hypothetical protein
MIELFEKSTVLEWDAIGIVLLVPSDKVTLTSITSNSLVKAEGI